MEKVFQQIDNLFVNGVINGVILYEKTASISNLAMPELNSCCP